MWRGPLEPQMTLSALPLLAQQLIVRRLSALGKQHRDSLRKCSVSWRSACDAQTSAVSVGVLSVAAALPFLGGLPFLRGVTVRGSDSDGSTLEGGTLATLVAPVTHLRLTSGCDSSVAFGLEEDSSPKMTMEYFTTLLRAWSYSLTRLNLINCCFPAGDSCMLNSPGFFRTLPHLQHLQLIGIQSTPAFTSLDVSGDNTLSTLDVSACTRLRTLACQDNTLATLNTSSCFSLEVLSVDNNRLITMDLSACTSLRQQSERAGHLIASEPTDPALQQQQHQHTGPIGLHAPADPGVSHQPHLHTGHLRLCTPGEPQLQQQPPEQHTGHLNVCQPRLAAVRQQRPGPPRSDTRLEVLSCESNRLTTLDVTSCPTLTHITCSGNRLTALDTAACTELRDLQCTSSPLSQLDLSACTSLTKLDVGHCSRLERLERPAALLLLLEVIQCEGCPLLPPPSEGPDCVTSSSQTTAAGAQ
ncbi:MAG: hypothetical protein WDW38_007167 [Sanguina aurantia]